jgi:hypothetical protein
VREHRPLASDEARRRGVEERVPDDVGRHQVGSELDARRLAAEAARQRLDEQRLAETGDAFDQHVRVGEQTDQHFVDDRALADHGLRKFAAQCLEELARLLQFLFRKNGSGRSGCIHVEDLRGRVPGCAGCAGRR